MLTKLSLEEIQERVLRLAELIHAPADSIPTFGSSEQTGRPHVEVDARGYQLVTSERGIEVDRETYVDVDGLLYGIFSHITFVISMDYELDHRIWGQDNRRILFSRQIELLSRLSPHWASLQEDEQQQILKRHPFENLPFN